ncbi:MAG: response regulator [Acidimicrobiia bacterium]
MSLQVVPDRREVVRVLIVDDHALFRRGLENVLSGEVDIDIVGEAGDGIEAVKRVDELRPDVVLMDVRMPKATGIEAARQIHERFPEVKVIMLTVSDDEDDLFAAVRAGAAGYLLKEVSIEEVADAVRSVSRGHSLISPSMATKLLAEFNALSQRAEERVRSQAPRLTDRELEVLKLVARGDSNKEIAGELFIAENTVKNHVRNILEKLHLHSRMEAVVYAMREKLLEVE